MKSAGVAPVLVGLACASLASAAQSAATPDVGLVAFVIVGDAVPAALAGLRGDAPRGRALVVDRRRGNCLICHSIPDVDEPFQGEIGPALAAVGARLNRGQIRLRLIDQSLLNPTTLMPPYYRIDGLHDVAPEFRGVPALSAQDIEDITAYLSSVQN